MLAIYLYREGTRTTRITSEHDEIWFGTRADVDIKLEGRDVAARHSVSIVNMHAWRGRCVAVDIANERTKHDLERPPPMVGMIAPR